MIGIIGTGRLGLSLFEFYNNTNKIVLTSSRNVDKKFMLNRKIYQNVDNTTNMRESRIIHLCIKPNDFEVLSQQIRPYIRNDHIFISWMAKTSINEISTKLNISDEQICRAMGSVLMRHNNGVICLYKNNTKYNLDSYFPCINKIWLDDEKHIDTCTIAAGCGPAYLSEFVDSIIKQNMAKGLKYEHSMLIAKENLRGLVHWLDQGLYTSYLKEQVASPGGLTEQGLNKIKNSNFDDIIKQLY